MVNVTIDGKKIQVREGTTIMDAAARCGIPIPSLCYLKDINEIAACRVCVVELEGKDRLITSCNNVVAEGMVLYTTVPRSAATGERSWSFSCPSTTAFAPPARGAGTAAFRRSPMI